MTINRLLLRLRWLNLPGGVLLILLQRMPVLSDLLSSENGLVAPSASMLRSAFLLPAVALGTVHSLAGATALVASPTSPASAQVGTSFSMGLFIQGGGGASVGSWRVTEAGPPNGIVPPGLSVRGGLVQSQALSSTLSITGTPTTAGSYTFNVQAYYGQNFTLDTLSNSITVKVTGAAAIAPSITTDPVSQTVAPGGTVTFSAAVSGSPAPTYQWQKNGTAISGATGTTYTVSNLSSTNSGLYSVMATNTAGSATSQAAGLFVSSDVSTVGHLSNLSVLATVPGTGNITAGFVINGAVPKLMLIRGVGPTLAAAPFNIPDILADPKLQLFTPAQSSPIATNDNWGDAPNATDIGNSLGFKLIQGSKDAAILIWLVPGQYTAQITSVDGTSGLGLIEVYEVQ